MSADCRLHNVNLICLSKVIVLPFHSATYKVYFKLVYRRRKRVFSIYIAFIYLQYDCEQ